MKRIVIGGQNGRSHIHLEAAIDMLPGLAGKNRAVILCDENVRRLHGHRFPDWPVIEISASEAKKSLATAGRLYRRLLQLGADRGTLLVGIGGGITCDLAGFVAATYMRGMPCAYVPTTLLAQVDAAIGGKCGVNLDGYKNIVGVFRQPRFVLCDDALLQTLPDREMSAGLAEVIKAAAIADAGLFALLEQNAERILARDRQPLRQAVARAAAVKARIVNRDETERGERRKLNFGHTLGHALEKVFAVSHGESVAIGMTAAARLSQKKGLLASGDASRLEELIGRCAGPWPGPLRLAPGARRELLAAMGRDKKRENGRLHLVLLEKIGSAVVRPVPLVELAAVLP